MRTDAFVQNALANIGQDMFTNPCTVIGTGQLLCNWCASFDGAFPTNLIRNKFVSRTIFVRRIKRGQLNEQIGDVEHPLRHVGQFQILVHRKAAQLFIRLIFRTMMAFHQQALGAFDHFALGQFEFGFG